MYIYFNDNNNYIYINLYIPAFSGCVTIRFYHNRFAIVL